MLSVSRLLPEKHHGNSKLVASAFSTLGDIIGDLRLVIDDWRSLTDDFRLTVFD
jgi:hypothetical protein